MKNKIMFNVTDEQKEIIKKYAEEKGLLLASYCRFVILKEIKKIKKERENASSTK